MRPRGADLFHIQHRKVTKIIHYWDIEVALADLGADPDTGSQAS